MPSQYRWTSDRWSSQNRTKRNTPHSTRCIRSSAKSSNWITLQSFGCQRVSYSGRTSGRFYCRESVTKVNNMNRLMRTYPVSEWQSMAVVICRLNCVTPTKRLYRTMCAVRASIRDTFTHRSCVHPDCMAPPSRCATVIKVERWSVTSMDHGYRLPLLALFIRLAARDYNRRDIPESRRICNGSHLWRTLFCDHRLVRRVVLSIYL